MKYLIFILLISCSSSSKKIINNKNIDASYTFEDDFWAQNYYNSTTLVVKEPIIVQNYEQIWSICKGETRDFLQNYSGTLKTQIKYMKDPLVIKTSSGFTKKVLVTKGICREIALYKQILTKKSSGDETNAFRKILTSMTIEYVYGFDSYATKIEFDTNYDGVKLMVK